MTITELAFRQAGPSDVDAIAEAHRDSIGSIGPAFYAAGDVEKWQEGLTGQLYLDAMAGGEVFFIATGQIDRTPLVLGFASDYRLGGTTHGTSVYVRSVAARQGIGTSLLRRAEDHAVAGGATRIEIEASLAGVEFYKANGYVEVAPARARLKSGHLLQCVCMRKDVARS